MIQLMSLQEVKSSGLPASRVQSISPFQNPAHVLSPPRHWLKALGSGEYGWGFFRLRYKSMLRKRFQAEPERFYALLDASEGKQPLTLTCHCFSDQSPSEQRLSGHCHLGLAREFLEILRAQRNPKPDHPAKRKNPVPPARQWAHRPNPGMELAMLIEHPHQSRLAHN